MSIIKLTLFFVKENCYWQIINHISAQLKEITLILFCFVCRDDIFSWKQFIPSNFLINNEQPWAEGISLLNQLLVIFFSELIMKFILYIFNFMELKYSNDQIFIIFIKSQLSFKKGLTIGNYLFGIAIIVNFL